MVSVVNSIRQMMMPNYLLTRFGQVKSHFEFEKQKQFRESWCIFFLFINCMRGIKRSSKTAESVCIKRENFSKGQKKTDFENR